MPGTRKQPYRRELAKRGDFTVWIVDGSFVRGHMDEEFTNFGQHHRFPYIPDKEFWLDDEAEHNEYAFFIDHLLVFRHAGFGQQLLPELNAGELAFVVGMAVSPIQGFEAIRGHSDDAQHCRVSFRVGETG